MKRKIGKLIMFVCGAGLVVLSAYGFIYSLMNLYLNHKIVWVGILATGLCLALSTVMLLSLSNWLRGNKISTGTTSTKTEEIKNV